MSRFPLVLAAIAPLFCEPLFAGDHTCRGVAISSSVRVGNAVTRSRAQVMPGQQMAIPIKDGNVFLRPTILENGCIQIAVLVVTTPVNEVGVNIMQCPKLTMMPGQQGVVAAMDFEVAVTPELFDPS